MDWAQLHNGEYFDFYNDTIFSLDKTSKYFQTHLSHSNFWDNLEQIIMAF